MNEILTIDKLGHRGDGVASDTKGSIFVPFSLEGERVEVSAKGVRRELVKVLAPSPARIDPTCQHFGKCGGCQLQHFAHKPYLAWKRQIVIDALGGQNIPSEIEPVLSFGDAKRRRAVFTASHARDGIELGYSGKATHNLINIESCPVLDDSISSNLEMIKLIIRPILPAKGASAIHVLACENGLDIFVEGQLPANEKNRQAAVRSAIEAGIARLSAGGETLIENRRPQLTMGAATLCPPAGTFVQAVEAVEKAMAKLICGHLDGCKKVADLFCGAGTFSLPLAENSTVLACESDGAALDALSDAWRATGGKLKAINIDKRDLYVRPVMAAELKKIRGVVFDPPRGGAEAQAKQLAISKVKKIAAVSCNPTTLARDLAILTVGGFKIERIVPLDQFVYTPHVEVVVLLAR